MDKAFFTKWFNINLVDFTYYDFLFVTNRTVPCMLTAVLLIHVDDTLTAARQLLYHLQLPLVGNISLGMTQGVRSMRDLGVGLYH